MTVSLYGAAMSYVEAVESGAIDATPEDREMVARFRRAHSELQDALRSLDGD
jgi:hypothetical protein